MTFEATYEAEIARLKHKLRPELALEIDEIVHDACEAWGVLNPGHGLGVKDSAIVAGRSLCARGYAQTDEEGRLLVFAARSYIADARRLFGA